MVSITLRESLLNLLDNVVQILGDTNIGISIRGATAALVTETWWMPSVGEVVITAAGAVIIAGVLVKADS